MISQFTLEGSLLKNYVPENKAPIWIDLLKPDDAEIAQIDSKYAVNLPTLEKMREIEISSRLYEEGGAYYMTFLYVTDALGDDPQASPFTFMLKDNLLVTVRYHDMRIVNNFIEKAQRRGLTGCKNGADIMTLILESIIDLCADAIEKGHTEIEEESRKTFRTSEGNKNYKQLLEQIAKIGDLNSKMRESLASLNRLTIFLAHAFRQTKVTKDTIAKVESLTADIQSLLDHAGFVLNKISFLLDATLGLVNIEQNAIIKIFSVAAVIFLPPTLVASIYGMNFKHMPELEWSVGYPIAIALMVLSALVPYWYFKRKKWL